MEVFEELLENSIWHPAPPPLSRAPVALGQLLAT
jgi:hypothetical protein